MSSRSIIKLISVLLILCPLSAYSQRVDSLKKVLVTAKGADRFDALFELAYEYSNEVDSISLIYSSQAYDLALQLGDTGRIVKGGRIKVAQLRRTERIEESIFLAEQILPIAERHGITSELKILLTSVAISHNLRAEYDKSLKYNLKALVIFESERDKKWMSISLNNIGVNYYKLNDFTRALEYYKKGLEYRQEIGEKVDVDRVLINMGLCYNALGEYKKAKKFINDGLNSCIGKCSDPIIVEGEIALGVSLLESDHNDEALEHFLKSLKVARRVKNYRFQAENLESISRVFLAKEDFGLTEKYLTEAETIAKERRYRFLLERVYKMFSKLYDKTGDYRKQSEYQSRYIKLKDSILNEKVISNLSQIRTEYEERENIKTIAKQDQVLSLQNEVIIRQQRQYIFIIVITSLVGTLAFLLLYFNRRQQRSNREISAAKNKIEEQNQKLADHNKQLEEEVTRRTGDLALSNKALQKLNDELDYFIYKSSHDIRGPLLTLKGMCNIALMDLSDPVAVDYFKKFDITTDKLNVILTRLQTVSYITHSTLKPVEIDFKRMIDDIIDFEKKKGVPDNMSFSYELAEDCVIISDEFLVRTIMENMIDNAVKFRSSSSRVNPFVKIKLQPEGKNLKISVEDNGIGIAKEYSHDMFKMFIRASEQSEIGGVGLYLIKLAIEQAGGEISLLQSGPTGSIFQALLPIDLNEVISERSKSEKKLVELLENQS